MRCLFLVELPCVFAQILRTCRRTREPRQCFIASDAQDSHDSRAHEFVPFQALADFKATKKTLGSNGNLWSLMVFLMVSDSLEKNLPRLGEIW